MVYIYFRESIFGIKNSCNKEYQLWRQDNHPVELYGAAFTKQKIEYIHQNPVAAGIDDKAEEYLYSSTKDYYKGKNCVLLMVELL